MYVLFKIHHDEWQNIINMDILHGKSQSRANMIFSTYISIWKCDLFSKCNVSNINIDWKSPCCDSES